MVPMVIQETVQGDTGTKVKGLTPGGALRTLRRDLFLLDALRCQRANTPEHTDISRRNVVTRYIS